MKYQLFFLGLLCVAPHLASAATLSVSPSASSVGVGNLVTVRILTNTAGTAVNEGGATLHFPSDLLDVVSISKGGSIFNLWVEEPSYSNTAGTVSFDGGLPNPGFTGSGTILTVTLHAKRTGSATFSLTDAAVRANDGLGTDVLTNASGAQIAITEPAQTPTAPVSTPSPAAATPTTAIPSTPVGSNAIVGLVSSTHPDPSAWYNTKDALLTWTLPKGATAVQTGLSKSSTELPTVNYQPAISSKEIKNIDDGISYFNLRAKVGGAWGPVSSYRLQIDTIAPTLGTPTFTYDAARHELIISNLHAADAGSGIQKYELTIDDGTSIIIPAGQIENETYHMTYRRSGNGPNISAVDATPGPSIGGTHATKLIVFDQAGNQTAVTNSFVVPIAIGDQVFFDLFGIDVTLLWFVIFTLALALASCAAAIAAWYKLLHLRANTGTKSAKREQIVHRALSLFKGDLERHIRTLEHARSSRELTAEEKSLRSDLADNLDNLEQYLKKEFKKFNI